MGRRVLCSAVYTCGLGARNVLNLLKRQVLYHLS